MERLTSFTFRPGRSVSLPLFIPVFSKRHPFESDPRQLFEIEGCIANAFFLYKDRETRTALESGLDVHDFLGFDGFVMTDSGAFQGFTRKLYLKNRTIVRFQDVIGADVVSPLDLVTPPGNNRATATRKLEQTNKRILEAKELVQRGILAGVQQGGRFPDLRLKSSEWLAGQELDYVALGSLVPFFNRRHDLAFVVTTIREARSVLGPRVPIHVYGAGDPVELPFMAAAGADIFDSSAFAHYAQSQSYMTPYGALRDAGRLVSGEYACPCPVCAEGDPPALFRDPGKLALHNLWTTLAVLAELRAACAAGTLGELLEDVLRTHTAWFEDSRLQPSWEAVH